MGEGLTDEIPNQLISLPCAEINPNLNDHHRTELELLSSLLPR